MKMASIIRFVRAQNRVSVIIFWWVAFCAFVLSPNLREGPFYFLFFSALFLTLLASQLFWIPRVVDLGARFVPGKSHRSWLTAIATVTCLFFFAYNIGPWNIPRGDSTHLTLRHILFEAPFWWWFVGSWVGFGLVIVFWTVDRTTRAAAWIYRKARKAAARHTAAPTPDAIALDPPSPARRRLLEQAAVRVSAAPFVAAAYGLLYCRLDVEVTRPRVALARLPKAFEGFRIVQLSDFHISPSPNSIYDFGVVAKPSQFRGIDFRVGWHPFLNLMLIALLSQPPSNLGCAVVDKAQENKASDTSCQL